MKTFDSVSNEVSIGGIDDGEKTRTEPERLPALSRLLSLIFRAHDRDDSCRGGSAEPPVPTLESIERELQAISDRASAALKNSAPGASGAPSLSSLQTRMPDRRELLREKREEARRAMEQDIVHLHRQLGTGITPDRMERLSRVLAAHAPLPGDFPGARFRDRIEMEVLRHLYARSGETAWSHLGDLLARTGLAWPPPDGLPLRISVEELQRRREIHNAGIRREFMLTPASQAALLIHGTIDVWRYGYPARSSYLWLQTALRAVAAALRAEAFAAAVELWLWRSADLEKEILECVSVNLGDSWRILEGGAAHAASGSVEVLARVDEICRTSIPQIVWKHAAKKLGGAWLSWPHTETADSEGSGRVDPVCGMTLPAGEEGERFERDGQVFHFCHASCRDEFEQSGSVGKMMHLHQGPTGPAL